jgi:serine/threonine protein phosphatase PrpC
MATDGLWDFMSSQEAVQLVDLYYQQENTASFVIVQVLKKAVLSRKVEPTEKQILSMISLPPKARRENYDDVTVMIIKLKP